MFIFCQLLFQNKRMTLYKQFVLFQKEKLPFCQFYSRDLLLEIHSFSKSGYRLIVLENFMTIYPF